MSCSFDTATQHRMVKFNLAASHSHAFLDAVRECTRNTWPESAEDTPVAGGERHNPTPRLKAVDSLRDLPASRRNSCKKRLRLTHVIGVC